MRYSCSFLLTIFLCLPLFAQEDKKTLVVPYQSLSEKKSDLYIPSIFASGKKGAVAKVLVDSSGVVKAGLVDGSGKFIVRPVYKGFGKVEHGFIPLIQISGKIDFFSLSVRELWNSDAIDYKIINPRLVYISRVHLWGIIHIKANGVIKSSSCLYKSLEYDSLQNSVRVKDYNSWKLFDMHENKTTFVFLCDSLFFEDSQKAVLYRNGNKISETWKDTGDVVQLMSGEKNNMIKTQSDVLTTNQSDKKFLKIKSDKGFGVIDSSGKTIIESVYDSIRGPFTNDTIFIAYKGKQVSIFDEKGNLLSEPQERSGKIYDFVEGRARFEKDGYIGFIDVRGNVRVAPQYKWIRDFKEGLSAVVLRGKWCFIDKDENIIVQPLYDEVMDFEKGIAAVRKGKDWFFLDKKGERTSVSSYDSVSLSINGKWIVYRSGKKGLVSALGKELLAPRYEHLEDIKENLVIVDKSGKWGVIDYSENFVIPLVYDQVKYCKPLDKFLVMESGKGTIFLLGENVNDSK